MTAHSFRHTYATIMAEAVGHNPFTLKELLGHQQLSMTERYCHAKAPCIPPDFQGMTDLGFSVERGVQGGQWTVSSPPPPLQTPKKIPQTLDRQGLAGLEKWWVIQESNL